MKRLCALLLVACASRPSPTPAPTPPVTAVAEPVDAGPPAPPTWPGQVETIVAETIETSKLYQTRTHVVWEEEVQASDDKMITAIIALDKKTLKRRTVHTQSSPIAHSRQEMMAQAERNFRRIYTNDDAIFLERANDILRITLDDKPPLRLPTPDERHCEDKTTLYRVDDTKGVTVMSFVKGQRSTHFPLALRKDMYLTECQVVNGALYLFLAVRESPKEWSDPRNTLGRVPVGGGAYESVVDIDGLEAFALASDGAFAFRTLPHSDPMFGHVELLEPGKPMRLVAKVTGMGFTVGINRTHVCWSVIPQPGPMMAVQGQILCAPRAGGEPAIAADHSGPQSSELLLDDDHLMWLSGGLRRVPVPR